MSSHCRSIHTLSKAAGGSEINNNNNNSNSNNNNNNNNPWPECKQTISTEQSLLVI
jgi:hypothetical protein